jgi:PRC-barrel domain
VSVSSRLTIKEDLKEDLSWIRLVRIGRLVNDWIGMSCISIVLWKSRGIVRGNRLILQLILDRSTSLFSGELPEYTRMKTQKIDTLSEQNARQLLGCAVIDTKDEKIGTMEGLWIDFSTHQIAFIGVRSSLFISKRSNCSGRQRSCSGGSQGCRG